MHRLTPCTLSTERLGMRAARNTAVAAQLGATAMDRDHVRAKQFSADLLRYRERLVVFAMVCMLTCFVLLPFLIGGVVLFAYAVLEEVGERLIGRNESPPDDSAECEIASRRATHRPSQSSHATPPSAGPELVYSLTNQVPQELNVRTCIPIQLRAFDRPEKRDALIAPDGDPG